MSIEGKKPLITGRRMAAMGACLGLMVGAAVIDGHLSNGQRETQLVPFSSTPLKIGAHAANATLDCGKSGDSSHLDILAPQANAGPLNVKIVGNMGAFLTNVSLRTGQKSFRITAPESLQKYAEGPFGTVINQDFPYASVEGSGIASAADYGVTFSNHTTGDQAYVMFGDSATASADGTFMQDFRIGCGEMPYTGVDSRTADPTKSWTIPR